MLFSVIIVLAGIVLQVKGCHFSVKPLDFYHCFRELESQIKKKKVNKIGKYVFL